MRIPESKYILKTHKSQAIFQNVQLDTNIAWEFYR